jgi:hypothetical protein
MKLSEIGDAEALFQYPSIVKYKCSTFGHTAVVVLLREAERSFEPGQEWGVGILVSCSNEKCDNQRMCKFFEKSEIVHVF